MTLQFQSVRVIMFRPAVDEFRGWTGPIGRSIIRLARAVRLSQMAFVKTKTGALRASITVGERNHWARGIQVNIGAGAGQRAGGADRMTRGYALANDQGAVRHKIYPRNRDGYLVFFWAKVGHVVRFKSVNHPGNRAYHWAERGLSSGLAAWNRT